MPISRREKAGKTLLGGLTGAATGASIGTAILPGIGTVAGAILGKTIGALATYFSTAPTQASVERAIKKKIKKDPKVAEELIRVAESSGDTETKNWLEKQVYDAQEKSVKAETKAETKKFKKEAKASSKEFGKKLKQLDKEIKKEKNVPALEARKKERENLLSSHQEKISELKAQLSPEGIAKRQQEAVKKLNPNVAYDALRQGSNPGFRRSEQPGNESYSSFGREPGKQSIWDEILHGNSKAANLTPQKTAAQSELLAAALKELQGSKQYDFEPLQNKVSERYQRDIVPSIMERFKGGALNRALASAGRDYKNDLSLLQQDYALKQRGLNQDLFRYGLTPLEVNTRDNDRNKGLVGNTADLLKDPNTYVALGGKVKELYDSWKSGRKPNNEGSSNNRTSPNTFQGGPAYQYDPNQGSYYKSPEEEFTPTPNPHGAVRDMLYPKQSGFDAGTSTQGGFTPTPNPYGAVRDMLYPKHLIR